MAKPEHFSSAIESTTYCRKQKSLGLLCSNFLSLYNRDGIETVGMDDAAMRLGVERRRIYDVVNVLESLGVLVRKGKNTYYWRGLGVIPKALEQLKAEGFRKNDEQIDLKSGKASDDDEEDENISNINYPSLPDKVDLDSIHKALGSFISENGKEKSLVLLTKNFIKLFLFSNSDMHSFDEAAKIFLGDPHNPSLSKAKVRRLYDVANVLSAMNFIEKTHHPETRKIVFRWLGMRGQTGPSNAMVHNGSKKKASGTELTNTNFKRSKLASPIYVDNDQKVKQFDHQGQNQPIKPIANGCNPNPGPDPCGHPNPMSLSKSCDGEGNKVNKTQDSGNPATDYRLQDRNEALKDLFAHYMDAWKDWYS